MSKHLEPWPVSATTYRHHGCRCPGCTQKQAEAIRRDRHARDRALLRVQSRAQNYAIRWVRKNHPDEWKRMLAEAYESLGIERRPVGRPRRQDVA